VGAGPEPALGLDPGARHDEVETTRVIAKVGWYYSALCVPSQRGAFDVFLQPQNG
jgi:hypothetical protein